MADPQPTPVSNNINAIQPNIGQTPQTPTVPGSQAPQQPQPLFKRLPTNPRQGLISQVVQKGSIVIASYRYAKHDRNPLILVSGVYGDKIYGLNLHYLVYPKLVETVQKYSNSLSLASWQAFKGDKVLADAFRSYKKEGLLQAKVLNKDFLVNALKQARSYDPQEQASIRQSITNTIRQAVNPRADQVGRAQQIPQTGVPQGPTGGIAPVGTNQTQGPVAPGQV